VVNEILAKLNQNEKISAVAPSPFLSVGSSV